MQTMTVDLRMDLAELADEAAELGGDMSAHDGTAGTIVREATRADLPAVLLTLGYLSSDEGPRVPVPITDAAMEAWREIEATPGRSVLVAETNGAVTGSVDLSVVPNLSRDASPYAIVENLALLPSARGGEVSRELLRRAIDLARAAGCYMVQLTASPYDAAAHALFQSLGFLPTATGFRLYLD
jgi:L-amino acid N-acyltransferase YncA